jgi:Cu-processing system permease protein
MSVAGNGPASPLLLCARQELVLAVRSRWTQIFAAVFAALSLSVAASGYVLSGGAGMQNFARTASSLVALILLLTPLTSLVIGVLALVPERGAAELLFAQPIARGRILLGRLLGLFTALTAAQAVGLGSAGVVIFSRAGESGAAGYAVLFAAAAVLTAIFLGLAALLSAFGAGHRARTLALALIAWFVAVVLFDVAALGAASLLRSGSASRLLITAVLVNPIDAVRTGALLAVQGTTAFGAASLAFLRFTRGPAGAAAWLLGSLTLWTMVPIALAARRLERSDL